MAPGYRWRYVSTSLSRDLGLSASQGTLVVRLLLQLNSIRKVLWIDIRPVLLRNYSLRPMLLITLSYSLPWPVSTPFAFYFSCCQFEVAYFLIGCQKYFTVIYTRKFCGAISGVCWSGGEYALQTSENLIWI